MRPKGSPKTPGSGRKKGTPNKQTAEIAEYAKRYTTVAVEALAHVAGHGESESARVGAAEAILDRAYGRPRQVTDASVTGDLRLEVVIRREGRKG